jgi:hypothetical protein
MADDQITRRDLEEAHDYLKSKDSLDVMLQRPAEAICLKNVARRKKRNREAFDWKKMQAGDVD